MATHFKTSKKSHLNRLKPIIESRNLILSHQSGFRSQHSTIDQVHGITNEIEKLFEEKNICSVDFLHGAQAFDKVWHEGLINKLKSCFALQYEYSTSPKSYTTERHLRVKQGNVYSKLAKISARDILGPLLYALCTKGIPLPPSSTMIAIFTDDKAIRPTEKTDDEVSLFKLQTATDAIGKWTKIWRIKLNKSKAIHVSFINIKRNHHPIMLLGVEFHTQILPNIWV